MTFSIALLFYLTSTTVVADQSPEPPLPSCHMQVFDATGKFFSLCLDALHEENETNFSIRLRQIRRTAILADRADWMQASYDLETTRVTLFQPLEKRWLGEQLPKLPNRAHSEYEVEAFWDMAEQMFHRGDYGPAENQYLELLRGLLKPNLACKRLAQIMEKRGNPAQSEMFSEKAKLYDQQLEQYEQGRVQINLMFKNNLPGKNREGGRGNSLGRTVERQGSLLPKHPASH